MLKATNQKAQASVWCACKTPMFVLLGSIILGKISDFGLSDVLSILE